LPAVKAPNWVTLLAGLGTVRNDAPPLAAWVIPNGATPPMTLAPNSLPPLLIPKFTPSALMASLETSAKRTLSITCCPPPISNRLMTFEFAAE